MILQELVKAISNLDSKVNAIAQSIVPMHERMTEVMAQHAFDKDLITHLLSYCSRDLANLKMESYCKYIEGLTALGVRRGVREAEEFTMAMDKLNKIVPDAFVKEMQNRHSEIEKWQKLVDEKSTQSRVAFLKLKEEIQNFHDETEKQKQSLRGLNKKVEKDIQKEAERIAQSAQDALDSHQASAQQTVAEFAQHCAKDLTQAKAELMRELAEKKSELLDAMADLEDSKSSISELVKQAGDTIIQANKEIALHNNRQPRSRSVRNK